MFSAGIALSGIMGSAEAGLFGLGSGKGCGCAEDCQPACCKPTIARPCHTNVYTYQRKCSDIKPPCCDDGCGVDPGCCAPVDPGCCAPVDPACCAPADPSCCVPADPSCCVPVDPGCCAPADPSCCVPVDPGCCAPADPTCCVPVDPSCCAPDACGEGCGECNREDACKVAKLIYTSMTDCYAKNRRNALDELGDYDCCCYPEIMNAFVYGLNDTDERVRAEAADEIGDQTRANKCCCNPTVVAALTCALADCDRGVRRQAEEALEACGYDVVDGNCNGCADGCASCGHVPAATADPGASTPAPAAAEPAPPAAPTGEPQAFFPSRLHNRPRSGGLAGLFGLNR